MEKAIIYVKMINICNTLKSRYWSHVSTAATNRTPAKNLCRSFPKQDGEGKNERLLQNFLRYTQTQEGVSDDLGVSVMYLLP